MNSETIFYYCDAAVDALKRGSGVAVVVRNATGQILDAASCCLAGMTNNEAEYEAVILGLEMALARPDPRERITFLVDSQVVVGQLAGQFAVRDRKLAPRHQQARHLFAQLPGATLAFIPRQQNRLADALAAEALEAGLSRSAEGRRSKGEFASDPPRFYTPAWETGVAR